MLFLPFFPEGTLRPPSRIPAGLSPLSREILPRFPAGGHNKTPPAHPLCKGREIARFHPFSPFRPPERSSSFSGDNGARRACSQASPGWYRLSSRQNARTKRVPLCADPAGTCPRHRCAAIIGQSRAKVKPFPRKSSPPAFSRRSARCFARLIPGRRPSRDPERFSPAPPRHFSTPARRFFAAAWNFPAFA